MPNLAAKGRVQPPFGRREIPMSLKSILFGREKSLTDSNLFHSISLIAVFAWVGLGADGLSSSCYGPEETFKALGGNTHLSLFVALASVITIVAICASYSQIISLFPTGGGGYLVASKLLSPGDRRRLGLRAPDRLRPDGHDLGGQRRRRPVQPFSRRDRRSTSSSPSRSRASSG
jgi:hypothetical protein